MIHDDHEFRGPASLRSSVDMKTCLEESGFRLLDAKCRDKDVDHDDDKDKGCGYIFQDVQLIVLACIVQVPLNCERKK